MNKQKDSEDRLLITLSDVISLFRRSKKRILRWVLAFGALGALFALIQPVRYQAEATFREKSNKSGGLSSSIISILGGEGLSSGQENEAATLIKSRKIMQEVVDKMHLQANLQKICPNDGLLALMRNNLRLSWAAFKGYPRPVLPDLQCPVKVDSVEYKGEVPINLVIHLKEKNAYEVHDASHPDKVYGKGYLGIPFETDDFNFILAAADPVQTVPAQPFSLSLDSLANTCDRLCKQIKIENAKTDKGVLKLSYENRDRYVACRFLNTTMQCYQDYLKKHHDKLAMLQLDYLNKRQTQLASNLNDIMLKHALFLTEDIHNSGFVDSNKEMDFLAKSQHEYREKLLANELEIKRLENIQPDAYVYHDSYNKNDGDSALINNVLKEIRDLKQRRDGLEIEIQRKTALRGDNLHDSLDQQLAELREVQENIIELQDVIDRFHQHLQPNLSKLLDDPRFLIKGWFDRLAHLEESDPIEWQKSRESFQYYLNNLERLFSVHEKILQTRLTHQQNPSGEYQGIDLRVADELYLDYSRQLIQLESTIRQNLFFIEQMEDPYFEVTSLSAGLNDPVSLEMIKKASDLVLKLRDLNNQSGREQDRFKDDLKVQRTFLTLHLKQMVQLMELNKKLIEEKVYALQNVSLELVSRQISLLENTLNDYVQSRLENLRQERMLMKQHLRIIHSEMAGLPKKWVSEQLIEQEVETNRLIVEEIAKMVESKNISHNLELIQSAPIDLALPPVHPKTPSLVFLTILGCLFGGLVGSGLVLGSSLSKGLKVSIDNLKLMGHHVSGLLSPLYKRLPDSNSISDQDLETLRRLRSYVAPIRLSTGAEQKATGRLLLIEGNGPDYSADLAALFVKKGKRVVLIDLDFGSSAQPSQTGLLHYLEKKIEFPSIEATAHGDVIQAGGMTRYSIELLGSQTFRDLMDHLQAHYDWIIGISHAMPKSAEAESLAPLFSSIAVSVNEEKVEELEFYSQLIEGQKHKVTFIVIDSSL